MIFFHFIISGFFVSWSICVHSSGNVRQASHYVDDKPGKTLLLWSPVNLRPVS